MCSKTAVAPLDRIKILLQAHSKHYKHLGVFSGLRQIVKLESFWALYKGNGAQMVRIFPYAATQFTAFEIYKRYLGTIMPAEFLWVKHADKFFAGAGAGVTAVTLTYPLDVVRARLAFQVTGEHKYSGIYNTAMSIFKNVSHLTLSSAGFFIHGFLSISGGRNPCLIPRIRADTDWNGALRGILLLLL